MLHFLSNSLALNISNAVDSYCTRILANQRVIFKRVIKYFVICKCVQNECHK